MEYGLKAFWNEVSLLSTEYAKTLKATGEMKKMCWNNLERIFKVEKAKDSAIKLGGLGLDKGGRNNGGG